MKATSRQIQTRIRSEVGDEVVGRRLERRLGLGGKHHELPSPRCAGRFDGRRLFEHDVGVRAAETEGTDSGAAGRGARAPLGERGVDIERAVRKVDLGVGLLEVQAWRNQAMLECERGLDEPGDPRGGIQVSEIRLDGAERTEARLVRRLEECLGERGHFDGVADGGPGPVRFDVADRIGWHVGHGQSFADRRYLALEPWRRVADFRSPVVVDRGSLDDCVDMRARADRVRQPLQDHQGDTAPIHCAARPSVERPAMPIGGRNPVLLIDISSVERHSDSGTACQGQVAFAREQALTRQVNRNSRRGAGGLHIDTRPFEVELVGYAGGGKVALVADHRLVGPHQLEHVRAGSQMVPKVGE